MRRYLVGGVVLEVFDHSSAVGSRQTERVALLPGEVDPGTVVPDGGGRQGGSLGLLRCDGSMRQAVVLRGSGWRPG